MHYDIQDSSKNLSKLAGIKLRFNVEESKGDNKQIESPDKCRIKSFKIETSPYEYGQEGCMNVDRFVKKAEQFFTD